MYLKLFIYFSPHCSMSSLTFYEYTIYNICLTVLERTAVISFLLTTMFTGELSMIYNKYYFLLLGCCFNGKKATPDCVEFDTLSIADDASICVEAVRTECSSNDVVLGSLESRREN